MRRLSILFISLFAVAHTLAQEQDTRLPILKLADSMKIQEKPILILLFTDWCKYCKMQKVQLEKNKDFQAAKQNFYFIEFDAETKESILFNKKEYHYKGNGILTGIHELAIELRDQEPGSSYPLWIILDKHYNVLLRLNGLITSEELKIIIDKLSNIK